VVNGEILDKKYIIIFNICYIESGSWQRQDVGENNFDEILGDPACINCG
jgi:hypothetical protein